MTIKEKQEICVKALTKWFVQEQENYDFKNHDEEIANLFTSKILLKKFDVFDINIILPDMLLLIFFICSSNNPGCTQVMLKDLLNNIKKRNGPIKPNYVITTLDFSSCFQSNFPIIEIPEINNKYESLWIGQKIETEGIGGDNLCDTIDWWKEVME